MKQQISSKAVAGVGLFAAIAASLCCITPVLVLLAGASGAASSLSWLEPARSLFNWFGYRNFSFCMVQSINH